MGTRGEGRCPACGQKLGAFELDSLKGIVLDRCDGCRGVWLDHREGLAIARRLEST
ncbi:MAG: zf-TFIIB domain-containing protein [Myxococcales bacterium]